MAAVGGSVKLPLFVLVSLLICSSLGSLKQTCRKNRYSTCGSCCGRAHRNCKLLCGNCLKFKGLTKCEVDAANKNYMKYFKSSGCMSECNMIVGRELQSDDSDVFQGNTLSPSAYKLAENGEEIGTFYR